MSHLPLPRGGHSILRRPFSSWTASQLHDERFVLVYCGHGLSRSVSILTGYLALKSGESPEAVLNIRSESSAPRSIRRHVHSRASFITSTGSAPERRHSSMDPAVNVQPPVLSLSFERCHIDREAILHIRFQQPLVSFVDLLDRDHLHIRRDVMRAAKV